MYVAWVIRYLIVLFQFLYENDTARLVVLLFIVLILPIIIGINTFPDKK